MALSVFVSSSEVFSEALMNGSFESEGIPYKPRGLPLHEVDVNQGYRRGGSRTLGRDKLINNLVLFVESSACRNVTAWTP